MTAFVDTSMWYAALDRGDVSHGRARELLDGSEPLVLSDDVLVETWRLAAYRLGYHVAENFWDGIRRGMATVETVGPADREAAWSVGRHYADQRFSIVDRSSFAVMERLGLRRALSFDADFAVYRFGVRGDQAFTVVR